MNSKSFAAFCLESADSDVPSRFGFTLPRALGKAVKRNYMKRRLREAVRAELSLLPANWVIVFNPRRALLDVNFDEIRGEVRRIFARCKDS